MADIIKIRYYQSEMSFKTRPNQSLNAIKRAFCDWKGWNSPEKYALALDDGSDKGLSDNLQVFPFYGMTLRIGERECSTT